MGVRRRGGGGAPAAGTPPAAAPPAQGGAGSWVASDAAARLIGVAITAAAFGNAWQGSVFIQDDQVAIVGNKDVTGETPWGRVVTSDFWGTDMWSDVSHRSYRPVTIAYLRLFVGAFGLCAPCLKVGNIAWHALNTVLVHVVCRRVVFKGQPSGAPLSLWAMVLFALHPVHTESVDGLVGVADLMSMAFALVALWRYDAAAPWHSALALAAAFLSKELGLTALVPYLFLVHHRADLPSRGVRVGVSVAAAGACLAWRSYLSGGGLRSNVVHGFKIADNLIPFIEDRASYVLTIVHVWWVYLVMLVCPVWLSGEYTLNAVPAVEPTAGNAAWLGGFAAACAAVVAAIAWRGAFPARFAALFFLAAFFPSSQVPFHPGAYIAERLMYMPSLGFCVFVAFVAGGAGAPRIPPLSSAVLGALAVWYATLTWDRNYYWRSGELLFGRAIEVYPNSSRANLNAAIPLIQGGDRAKADAALRMVRRSREVYPEFCQPDYWEARYYLDHAKNLTRSKELFWKATKCRELQHYSHAYHALERIHEAEMNAWPRNPVHQADLANLLVHLSRFPEAERHALQCLDKLAAQRKADGAPPPSQYPWAPKDVDFAYALAAARNAAAQRARPAERALQILGRHAESGGRAPLSAQRDAAVGLLSQLGVKIERRKV